MKKPFFLALVCCLAALAAAGCGHSRSGHGLAEAEVAQEFPLPTVPAMVSSQQEAAEYIVKHYWNRFLDEPRKGAEDTSKVCGFTVSQFNEALSQYAGILGAVPLQVATRAETALLEKVGEMQRQNPDSRIWNRFAEGLDFLLGNPNSNLRNEELYIPLLQSRIDSPFATDEEKESAARDLPLFKLNRVGQKAADFPFRLMNGRTSSLYAIESGYIILFFSNPGCPACREIMETLASLPDFDQLIADKTLAVANIYPDEDLAAWREYASIYPKNWYNGYDEYQTIYNTPLYHIRAIPSVYLLDSEKKVILKDAPTELLVSVLSQLLYGE